MEPWGRSKQRHTNRVTCSYNTERQTDKGMTLARIRTPSPCMKASAIINKTPSSLEPKETPSTEAQI
ncbi:hypothetical protein E2C01_007160 [Portunus trituberculatus]|uniref:Uncharacterized protein n=1 Tax=Portunus trituberculatus TaxID=210409 RepID=A0A5B7CZB6_PORTR|nr:hypothetical protein [Portunus trituberculatus]